MMERIKEVTGRYPFLLSQVLGSGQYAFITDPRLINADWWLGVLSDSLPYPLHARNAASVLPTGVNKVVDFIRLAKKARGERLGRGWSLLR